MLTTARNRYPTTKSETGRLVDLKEQNHILRNEVDNLRNAFSSLRKIQEFIDNVDSPEMDVMALVDTILVAALASIEAKDGSLLLVDEEANELAFVVVHGEAKERLMGHRIPMKTGIAGWVAHHKEPVVVANVNLDPRFSQAVDRNFQFKTTSLLCAPVERKGKVLGVIQGLNKINGKTFNNADLTLLFVVAREAAEAIHRINSLDGD